MAKKIVRTLMPAHHSDRITVEQAREAFLKVEAEARERANRRKRKAAAAQPTEVQKP